MASPLRQYRVREVANILSLSVREVWRLVAKQQLTPPVKIGRCSIWFESDIAHFQARLLTQRERRTV
jgi:predicted DNA-binding transcriptional regulator AlpA